MVSDNTGGRALAKNSLLVTLSSALAPVVALVTAPILARVLGVDGRGEVAAATAPLFLAAALTTLALPEATTYLVARNPQWARRIAGKALLLIGLSGIVGVGAVLILAVPLSAGDSTLAQLIGVAAAALIPIQVTAVLRGVAAAKSQWALVVLDRTAAAIIRLVGIVAFAASGGLMPLTAVIIIATAPALSGVVYAGLRRYDGSLSTAAPPTGLYSYALRMWGGTIGAVLLSRLDQVLMTPLAGVYELGLYAVAVSIGEVPIVAQLALRQVFFSADAGRRDNTLLSRASRLMVTATVLAAAIIALLTPWGIPFLFGTSFAGAIPPTLILVLGTVFTGISTVSAAGLAARGYPGRLTIITLITLGLAVIMLLLLIPPLGATGAAIATASASLVNMFMTVATFARAERISPLHMIIIRRTDLVTVHQQFRRRRD